MFGAQDAVVRLAAASVLVELYGEEGHVSMLSKFTMRFAGRYAELVYDLSEAVSVTGVSVFASFSTFLHQVSLLHRLCCSRCS